MPVVAPTSAVPVQPATPPVVVAVPPLAGPSLVMRVSPIEIVPSGLVAPRVAATAATTDQATAVPLVGNNEVQVTVAVGFELPTAKPKVENAGGADEPVSTALMKESFAPALIRSSGMLLKWGSILALMLGGGYLAMKTLVPLMKELSNPKPPSTVIDKNAPTLVKVLQQTRQVTARSDANVAYLNQIVAGGDAPHLVVKPPVVVAPPPPPPSPVVAPLAKDDLSPFHTAIAQFKIDGAVGGASPRAFIDGRLVKYGEIVNRNLGLRFVGVDMEEHIVLFTNAENVVFKKHF